MSAVVVAEHYATTGRPQKLRESRVPWSEGLPLSRTLACQCSEHLADDASMGHYGDVALVPGRESGHRPQAPAAKLVVALAAGPAEMLVRLLEIGRPEVRIVPPNLLQWDTVQHAAVDLLKIRTEVQLSEVAQRGSGFPGPPEWTRIDGVEPRLASQAQSKKSNFLLPASAQGKVCSALQDRAASHSAVAGRVCVSNEQQSKRQATELTLKERPGEHEAGREPAVKGKLLPVYRGNPGEDIR
jgi:hypothetical protein